MNYFIKPNYSNLKTFVINLDDYKENYEKTIAIFTILRIKN